MSNLASASLTMRNQFYACARDARYLADVLDQCAPSDIAELLIAYVPEDAIAELVCKHAGDRLEADAIEEAMGDAAWSAAA
jgi:hypothetical protein